MKKILLKFLNVESEELIAVLFLLLQGFLIGVFIATFEVTGGTLFVQYFDIDTFMPIATVSQGLLGIVATYIFSYFQNRISFPRLAVISLLLTAGIISFIRYEFGSDLSPEAMEADRVLIFICYIMIRPLEAIVLLIFWGTIARMFTLKQQKRIVGGIDLGKALATLATFFAIPIFNNYLETVDFLIVSNVCVVAILLLVFGLVSQSVNLSFFAKESDVKEEKVKFSFIQMFKSQYILMMISFVFVSTIAGNFIDFSFLNAVQTQYPDENDLGNFIAVFGGITIIFSILAQTFAGDYITETYGLRIILLINPILLVLFTTLTVLVGSLMGFTVDSGSFLLFFLCMALTKLFSQSLKEAFDEPSFKMFIFPVPANVRLKVLTRLDGIIKVSAVLLGGGFLYIIENSNIFNLLSFSFFLLPILIIWMWVINSLHLQYRNSLKATLSSTQGTKKLNTIQSRDDSNLILNLALEKVFEDDQEDNIKAAQTITILKIMEKTEPSFFENTLLKLKNSSIPKLNQYVAFKIKELPYSLQADFLETTPSFEEVQKLSKSRNYTDRIEACKWLSMFPDEKNTGTILLMLLKDIEPAVKIKAIDTARLLKNFEVLPVIVEMLGNKSYANFASDTLVEMGERIIPMLELAFYKSGQKEEVMLKIIQIYGHIGTEEAIQQLWKKINHPSHLVIDQIILSFSYCNVEVPEENLPIIYNLLEIEIGDAAWDITALTEIKADEVNAPLKLSLEEEVDYNFTNIFRLLSLIYDSQSIQLVEDSLDSEGDEGKVFALELLDLFVAKEIKPILFPVLEDINALERINKLQEYFPRESFNSIDILKNIIVRDYKYTNRWTRTSAMYAIANTEGVDNLDELVSNVFHSDLLIRNTAALAICMKDRAIFENLKNRLDKNAVREMEEILEKAFSDDYFMPLRIQKVLFLREVPILREIQGDILADMVELFKEVPLKKNQKLVFEKKQLKECLFLVAKGSVEYYENNELAGVFEAKELLGEMMSFNEDIQSIEIISLENSILYQIDSDGFYEMMTGKPNLVRNFIKNRNGMIQTMKEEQQLLID